MTEAEVVPSPTRREMSTDQRRHDIVGRAADLFEASGYASSSMGQIGAAAGLAKPTLYHYFASKDEILFAIHDEFMSLLTDRMAARDGSTLSPTARVQAVIADILGLMQTHGGHVRVFFEHYRELPPERQAQIRVRRDKYEQEVQASIEEGIATGEFRTVDSRLTTLALFGMCNWAYQWYRVDGSRTPDQIAAEFADLLVHGMADPGGTP